MNHSRKIMSCLVAGLLCLIVTNEARSQSNSLIREEQTIEINGVKEIWRLQWKEAPQPTCSAADEASQTCPCNSFRYGQGGDLELVRLQNGKQIDALSLGQFFEWPEKDKAIVQYWPEKEGDIDLAYSNPSDLAKKVSKRKPARIMNFSDYDHDGHATEFYLPTENLSCGHVVGIVIGVSSSIPHLHAFGVASSPEKPIALQDFEWQALKEGKKTVLDWACGDHGSEAEAELVFNSKPGSFAPVLKHYACTENGKRAALTSEEKLDGGH